MKVAEIERYIRPLSYAEKIQLIQDIAEMLHEVTENSLLHRLHKAAEASGHYDAGPLEAYEAAEQLQSLTKEEAAL